MLSHFKKIQKFLNQPTNNLYMKKLSLVVFAASLFLQGCGYSSYIKTSDEAHILIIRKKFEFNTRTFLFLIDNFTYRNRLET